MIYPIFNVIITSSSLAIIKDRDIFFNYPAKIEILSVTFPAFILNLAKAIDRFSAVCLTFIRSFF
jgi:hypothetical protein